MPPSSTISSKGQITVPIEIRQRLGLKQGDRVEFAIEGDHTVIRPAPPQDDVFAKWVGAFPYFNSREEIVAYYREMRGHEEEDDE